ncbi:MAG: preprotein translocase subunit YajC [Eubacteriales bacterium]|nr:preprotein translocase subunit YajC [Eubacteriales bacterium]
MDQFFALLPLILLIFIMYFLMIRPQRKKEKAIAAMRNSLRVGDEVITIGGVLGKIVKTKGDVLTIQVGADKIKFEVMRWAVSTVTNKEPAPSPSKRVETEQYEDEQEETPKKTMPKRMKRATESGPESDPEIEEDNDK